MLILTIRPIWIFPFFLFMTRRLINIIPFWKKILIKCDLFLKKPIC